MLIFIPSSLYLQYIVLVSLVVVAEIVAGVLGLLFRGEVVS